MKLPEQVWAVAMAILGVSLEVTLLFAHGASEATRHDAHGAAFGLIMGAVGAFKTSRSDSAINATSSTINQPVITDETK